MRRYKDIINGVRKNDTQAQMAFYELFFQSVYRSACVIVGNQDEAEEIMQDTIMKVLMKTTLLNDDEGVMRRILKRIACNRAIDQIRKRKDFFTSMEDGLWIESEADEIDENELNIEHVKESIEQLGVGYRSIISLRLFEGMSFAEIAAQLEINPSTVRVQYTRGIAKLRVYLLQKPRNYE